MAPASNGNGNGRQHNSQQSLNSTVKSICDIMRRSNCRGGLAVCAGADLDSVPAHPGRAGGTGGGGGGGHRARDSFLR